MYYHTIIEAVTTYGPNVASIFFKSFRFRLIEAQLVVLMISGQVLSKTLPA